MRGSVLQCVAVRRSVFLCVAVCCSVLSHPKPGRLESLTSNVCVHVLQMCVYVLQILIHTYGTKRGRPHMHLSTHEGNAQGLKRLENTQTNKNLVVMLVDFFCCLLDGLA